MTLRMLMRVVTCVLLCYAVAIAQTPSPPSPRKAAPPVTASTREKLPAAPQVETIAAWLPGADEEFGPPAIAEPVPPQPLKAKSPRAPVKSFPRIANSLFESPDITVIGPGGKPLAAKY